MAIDPSFSRAASAYQNNLRLGQSGGGMPGMSGDSSGHASFMDMLGNAISDAIDTQHATENLKMEAVSGGKVDLSHLVTAVADAELVLNTVVAIRDRVISAYQDIIRMPI